MSKTVLIAEDHADIRLMTRFMLTSIGYDVIEARDGYEAVEEAKQHHPDLILMDIAMPILNGITAAHLIRSYENCHDIPIIAVTAYGKDYLNHEEEYGFDRIVEKPVNIDELRHLVGEYLDSSH